MASIPRELVARTRDALPHPFRRGALDGLGRSCSAVTALEYGLIAALIAVVIIVAVTALGTNLSTTFNTVAGHFGVSVN